MKKLILLPMCILLFTFAFVGASDYTIDIDPIRDEINPLEDAQFLATVTNTGDTIGDFNIYTPDVTWSIPPTTFKVYTTSPNNVEEVKLVITPTKYVEPGLQLLKLRFKESTTDELIEETVQIYVKSNSTRTGYYQPSIRMDVDVPEEIDPRDTIKATVSLENLNVIDYKDLKLVVSSDLESFNKEETIDLGPTRRKTIEISYSLDPLTQPKEYEVDFILYDGEEVIEEATSIAKVKSINPDFKEDIEVESMFFKKIISTTYTSQSNVLDKQVIKKKTNIVKNIFTSAVPEAEIMKDVDGSYLSWELELDPGESKNITTTVNYRPIIYILLLILLGIVLYYNYRSPIILTKSVSDVATKEGGISNIKVTLQLKSISKKPVKKLTITDTIPNIAELEKHFVEGTLKPTKILKSSKGTRLVWEIDEIAPGEDRLIRYDLKSKLSIVGNFKLPRSKATFRQKRKERTSYSNLASVSS